MPGKLMQGGFKIKVCLLASLKKANGALSFLIRQLQTAHQLLCRCNLGLRHPPVRFADVAEGGEDCPEESITGTVNTTQVTQEPVCHVAQKNTKDEAGYTAPHQANNAANHFAPDIGWNCETLFTHSYPYDHEPRKYIIATQPGTVKKEK